jgi:predicted PurR-regulated permease PerM
MLSDTQRYAVYFGALLIIAGIAWLLGPILSPFVGAAIFAYICVPLADRLSRRKLPRTLAVVLVMLMAVVILVALLLVLMPLIEQQVQAVAAQLPAFWAWFEGQARPWLTKQLGIDLSLDLSSVRESLGPVLQSGSDLLRRAVPSITSGGLALLGFLGAAALFPVVLFYFLRDWHLILTSIENLVPRRAQSELVGIAREVDEVLGEFLRGQLSVMLSLALFYTVALWAVGLNSALSIGLVTGLLAFVPYLGFTLGVALASAVGLIQFHSVLSLVPIWIVFGVGQLLESYVLTPWLVGDRVGLHPVWVIFAILAFGHLLGFVGVLLAVPLASVTLVLLRHLKRRYQASGLYRD